MKKILLGLTLVATLTMVSCKQETKVEVGEAADAVGAEMDQAIDTAAARLDTAIDSTKSKTGAALEKGAAKMNAASEKMKEAAKK